MTAITSAEPSPTSSKASQTQSKHPPSGASTRAPSAPAKDNTPNMDSDSAPSLSPRSVASSFDSSFDAQDQSDFRVDPLSIDPSRPPRKATFLYCSERCRLIDLQSHTVTYPSHRRNGSIGSVSSLLETLTTKGSLETPEVQVSSNADFFAMLGKGVKPKAIINGYTKRQSTSSVFSSSSRDSAASAPHPIGSPMSGTHFDHAGRPTSASLIPPIMQRASSYQSALDATYTQDSTPLSTSLLYNYPLALPARAPSSTILSSSHNSSFDRRPSLLSLERRPSATSAIEQTTTRARTPSSTSRHKSEPDMMGPEPFGVPPARWRQPPVCCSPDLCLRTLTHPLSMLSLPRPRRKERRCILWRKWTGSSNRSRSCPLSYSTQTPNAAPAQSSSGPRSPTQTLPRSLAPTAPYRLYPSPIRPQPKASSAGTICLMGRSCQRTRSLACARATRPVERSYSTSLLFFDLSVLSHVQR